MVQCNSDAEKFADIHERLDRASSDLQVANDFSSERRQVAMAKDQRQMKVMMEELLQLGGAQAEAQGKLASDNAIIKSQLAQLLQKTAVAVTVAAATVAATTVAAAGAGWESVPAAVAILH